jgi:hypothetical protein
METVFSLNLVSKYCSEFQQFVKIYSFLTVCPFLLRMKFYIPNVWKYLLAHMCIILIDMKKYIEMFE